MSVQHSMGYLEYIGGYTRGYTGGYHNECGGDHEYSRVVSTPGDIMNMLGDTMTSVGDIMIPGDVQYTGVSIQIQLFSQ